MKDEISRKAIRDILTALDESYGLTARWECHPMMRLVEPAINVRKEFKKLNERLDRLFNYLKIEEVQVFEKKYTKIEPIKCKTCQPEKDPSN